MQLHNLRRIFVWELPVRIYHWLNALAILVLCVTGYLIGDPPGIMSNEEASYRFLFGWIRYIHFIAAYILTFNFLFRVYWGFVGNRFATWNNFIPLNWTFMRKLWDVIKTDILMIKKGAYHSVGHNPLAGFFYLLTFVATVVMVFTGFGLYADMSTWFFPKMFGWVGPMLGGDFGLRNIHHSVMWFFVVFTLIHVYLVFYHDYVEGKGEISSMGGGYKFVDVRKVQDVDVEEVEEMAA